MSTVPWDEIFSIEDPVEVVYLLYDVEVVPLVPLVDDHIPRPSVGSKEIL